MKNFNLFCTLLKTGFRDSFFTASKQFSAGNTALTEEERQKRKKKKTGKIIGGIAIAFALILMLAYIVMYVAIITVNAAASGLHEELLYTLLATVQLVVIFFGSVTTINNMFYGKDNQLLMSLPVPTGVIFGVKFTLSYLSELLICALMALPMLITYGVSCSAAGISIGAGFYIISIISIFLLPILPLLVISLLSIPLMYVMSFLKKRVIGKTIVVVILTAAVLALYFLLIGGVTSMAGGEDGELGSGTVSLLTGTAKAALFNYNLVQSMLGVNAFVNFLICLAGLVGIFALVVFLSSIFYRKGISVVMEEGSGGKKKKSKRVQNTYAKIGFRKSFFLKEIKSIFNTPQLLLNSILGVVMIPLLVFIFGKGNMFNFSEGEVVTMGSELGFIGFICYFAAIMTASTNMISLIGFSMEGKNMQILKSLPISPKDIVIGKLVTANITSAITALVTAISFIVVSSYHNVLVGLAILIVLLCNGLASSGIGLYSDMNNPKFKFNNLNELTKNNKKALKPMLLNVLIGLTYMVLGIVFSAITGGENGMNYIVAYVIFFAVMLLINFLFAFVTIKKLFEKVDVAVAEMEV